MNSGYEHDNFFAESEEGLIQAETIPPFNAEFSALLTDKRTGAKVAVVTPRNMADFALARGRSDISERNSYFLLFRVLLGRKESRYLVEGEEYSLQTRSTQCGIKVEGIPRVIEMVENDELPKFSEKRRLNFLEFAEALFTPDNRSEKAPDN